MSLISRYISVTGLLALMFMLSPPIATSIYLFRVRIPRIAKGAVPFGVALRIKRNCSTNDFLQNRCKEYKEYLKSQNYPAELVDKQFGKALSISRSELLSKKVKPHKKVFPLVLDYNPIFPDIQKVIKKHFDLLQSSPEVKEISPSKSIFPAYRRTKNLKEMLAPSKFQATSCRNQGEESGGCSKCDKKCDLCKNYLIQASKFQSYQKALSSIAIFTGSQRNFSIQVDISRVS